MKGFGCKQWPCSTLRPQLAEATTLCCSMVEVLRDAQVFTPELAAGTWSGWRGVHMSMPWGLLVLLRADLSTPDHTNCPGSCPSPSPPWAVPPHGVSEHHPTLLYGWMPHFPGSASQIFIPCIPYQLTRKCSLCLNYYGG